jgi:hypothetical protein
MNLTDLAAFAPQRTFLLQGQEADFAALQQNAHDASVHFFTAPRFTKDHASQIGTFIAEGTGQERTVVIFFSVFSPDAAQVLLKPLEEPSGATTIVLITPHPYLVPQTIRSRVVIIARRKYQVSADAFAWKKDAITEYAKETFGSESEEDAALRRAKAVILLDQLEVQYARQHDKARAIYEAKHLLFAANIPTKFVVDYAISLTF